ncbi:SHOCT domain-containing protein [Sulfobacillus harzensis]|uniref:SHOCT domain-containing protein n=1 Tax=Sulfobacillus harzensis TaxID=2729629 RepID=A0A7Y0L2K1_9FIRM|nr:SHOCT domain-containing protein [Sulfobacillus harzensis]NMP21566.1 SHOCT domain-containing protein [Sulfobacillus harzensis]
MMGLLGAGGFAGMWIMGLFGLLILAGVIVLIVWAIRALLPPRSSEPWRSNDPLAQLQLRLARGEITPDVYEELRAHLRD